MVIPSSPRPEFREDTIILQQRAPLAICSLLLIIVVPIRVAESEICLTGQSQHRNLVQYRLHPQALDLILDVSWIAVIARVFNRIEFYVNLLFRFESELR